MERVTFVSDDNYKIYPISEENRVWYMELFNSGLSGKKLNQKILTDNDIWNHAVYSETKNYSIYNKNEQYCGNLELQKPTTDTPEIGIELLENFRNKGIAQAVVPMFLKAVYDQQNVQYFVIRIRSSNACSIHVFEKLGAELDCKEESALLMLLNKYEEIREAAIKASLPVDESDSLFDSILVYKLNPQKLYE